MAPKFTAEKIDYSLYLVTGRELLPPGKVNTTSPEYGMVQS